MLSDMTSRRVRAGWGMRAVVLYGIARVVFGIAALVAPATAGRLIAGEGGATPGAQAYLRGMGGREVGVGLGVLSAIRGGGRIHTWLIAGVLSDCGDIAGITGAWSDVPPAKRWLGLATGRGRRDRRCGACGGWAPGSRLAAGHFTSVATTAQPTIIGTTGVRPAAFLCAARQSSTRLDTPPTTTGHRSLPAHRRLPDRPGGWWREARPPSRPNICSARTR